MPQASSKRIRFLLAAATATILSAFLSLQNVLIQTDSYRKQEHYRRSVIVHEN